MPGALILINGFPAVGKHSVARELITLLPECKFLDTRNLVAAASQLFPPTDAAHGLLRKNLVRLLLPPCSADPSQKHAIFDSIARTYSSPNPTRPPPIYILTDFLSVAARPTDREIMSEFIAFAQSTGFAFIHVILGCSTDENVRRLACSKGMEVATLLEMRMEEEIGHMAPLPGLVGEFELDTTALDPQMTAGVLAEYCLDVLRADDWWIHLNGASVRPSSVVDKTISPIDEVPELGREDERKSHSPSKRSSGKLSLSLGIRKSFSAG
ncbi:hypothetical protein CcaverHIS002_0203240 [Cutaneotrichosporon cavernicola]|uniref:Uncharacterized protein n=1 Tax=Cutaneotrichosporon cavernicola TaxID=279322 RepID=A0AA48I0N9_9TREE|nr:uncharacterized protein CcaverHIS019_0203230 [Cutaneotrichosporon cavernicola]BEI81164.1 hypothetical protein CcaverHIS002_0203240 [Cutaneotrichosporon cavernicola]BEI88961.1 hypothetical protein CcaverHIS019_0203230 [Cutaneotrichosporon cavernicola]BEI96738.1 hypothetical protein CcaverHIS631_0203270 [Cutaneotrichosporon cavernicola]BEJ04510.1 hypothetical protein CcaverHIS641_0203270 [Cutaneotrichosporon cavernicola]